MTIVIDTTPLHTGHKARGIGRYTRQLAESLGKIESSHHIILTSKVNSVDFPDLVHYPYFDLFQSHLPFLPQARKELVTIHDLIPLRLKEAFQPGIRSGFNLWIQMQLIKRMSGIITDSNYSKKDINEFLNIDSSRIFVIPLGVHREFHPVSPSLIERVRKRYQLPQKYILYVGDVNINKNIPVLIQALKNIPIPLVIVSSSISHHSLPEVKLIEKTIRENDLNERVIKLDSVPFDPSSDLVALYCGASLYVQPSLYEGFGLPILEAMACGTPVVSSNATSLPEVAGGAALLVDPTAVSIENGIRRFLENGRMRTEFRARGFQRAKMMTWEETARRTFNLYESIISGK